MPYILVLFCYPVLYYITHWQRYYRRPLDPIFVVLAVFAFVPLEVPRFSTVERTARVRGLSLCDKHAGAEDPEKEISIPPR
jgi:hypothetical protein